MNMAGSSHNIGIKGSNSGFIAGNQNHPGSSMMVSGNATGMNNAGDYKMKQNSSNQSI